MKNFLIPLLLAIFLLTINSCSDLPGTNPGSPTDTLIVRDTIRDTIYVSVTDTLLIVDTLEIIKEIFRTDTFLVTLPPDTVILMSVGATLDSLLSPDTTYLINGPDLYILDQDRAFPTIDTFTTWHIFYEKDGIPYVKGTMPLTEN